MKAPDPALVERFRDEVNGLVARSLDVRSVNLDRVGVALSGGPDSVALLLLATLAFPDGVLAATVDHGLRPESAAEASLAQRVAISLGVPHVILDPAKPIGPSNVQAGAREARYAALDAWAREADIYPVLTAHHADDQAETLLMRLNRGSGVAGLSAIRPFRHLGHVVAIRPLLGWRRAALREIVDQAGLPFVDDPSNSDRRYDRTRMRALIAATPGLDIEALSRSAAYIGEAEEALSTVELLEWANRWNGHDQSLDTSGLPREIVRRLLRRALHTVRAERGIILPEFTDATNVEPLLDAVLTGGAATQAGIAVRADPTDRWHFKVAPPRRSL